MGSLPLPALLHLSLTPFCSFWSRGVACLRWPSPGIVVCLLDLELV